MYAAGFRKDDALSPTPRGTPRPKPRGPNPVHGIVLLERKLATVSRCIRSSRRIAHAPDFGPTRALGIWYSIARAKREDSPRNHRHRPLVM